MQWLRKIALALFLTAVCATHISAQTAVPTGVIAQPHTFPFTSDLLRDADPLQRPSSLQFGPDGRLYVSETGGMIRIFTIERLAQGVYRVTDAQTIDLIQQIPNHDDDGQPQPHIQRQVTGILVTGTADQPVIYVTSSDFRQSLHIDNGLDVDSKVDTNSGVLSRLTWDGGAWRKLDLVRGLPRSPLDHATNGMALDAGTHTLYVAQGGNTNMGASLDDNDITPEYAYSAAILSVDLDAIGDATYDLPTLDDPNRPGNPDANDPFGGDGGLNQAVITPDSPVQVYASGFRNPYDLVLTENGLYTIVNGANSGWGGTPTGCTNATNDTVFPSDPVSLHRVTAGYYAGHPNPTRGSAANLFAGQSPITQADPQECDYIPPAQTGALALWEGSINGLAAYTASNFGGALKGSLLAADYYGPLRRIQLNDSGSAVIEDDILFANYGAYPLDVTAQGDSDPFPGTIWVAVLGDSKIQVFEPLDYQGAEISTGSVATYSTSLDSDGDGYSNADEYDNASDPLNPASRPPDFDGDYISDRNDPDDDNDGIDDRNDPFAIDPANGATTTLPLDFTWDGGNPGTGLLGTGFTGLMINHANDTSALFDPDQIIAGGANGWLTLEDVPPGDPIQDRNDQRDALQVGVPNGAFTVKTRLLPPFFDQATPQLYQSEGVYVGTGDQDNYAKLILTSYGFQVVYEEAGAATEFNYPLDVAALLHSQWIDLFLYVDDQGAVHPAYRASDGAERALPPVRPAWLPDAPTLAVGILATSKEAPTFTAIWDYLTVVPGLDAALTAIPAPSAQPTAASDALIAAAPVCAFRSGTDVPIPRFESQSLLIDGRVYVIGGFTSELVGVDRLDIYDVANDQWSRGADLPHAGTHQATVYDPQTRQIWMAGGFLGSDPGPATDEVWTYDTAADRWMPAPPLPLPVGSAQLVLLGRTLHFLGGFASDRETNLTAHFTLNLDDPNAVWQQGLAPMIQPRAHFAAKVLDGAIYAVGGQLRHEVNAREFASVERYDPATDTWTPAAALPFAISHTEAATFVYGGKLYVVGGRALAIQREGVPDVQVYDPAADTWTTAGYLPAPRTGVFVDIVDGEYVVIGGGRSWIFPATEVWVGQIGKVCASLNDHVALPTVEMQAAHTPLALVEIAPPPGEHPSTYDAGSFRIANLSTGGQQIVSVHFDLSGSLLPNTIFDPDGTKGDTDGKPFTVDQADGLQVTDSQLTDTTLTLHFADFDPGRTLTFSLDIDPAGLRGQPAPSPDSASSVDGIELIGTQVTLEFSDGSQRTTWLYRLLDSDHGSGNITDIPTDAPALRIVGTSSDADQQVVRFPDLPALRVTGRAGDRVLVLIAYGTYHTGDDLGAPPDAFAFNAIDQFVEQTVTIPESGSVEVPIAFKDAGIYTAAAVIQDANGAFSRVSNVVTLAYGS